MRNHKKKFCTAAYIILCIVFCLFILNSSYSIFTLKTESLDITEPFKLKSGQTLSQQFNGYSGVMKNLYVKFGTYRRVNNGQIHVQLLGNDNLIQEWHLDVSELVDNEYKKFELSKCHHMENDINYTLQITETYNGENAIAVYLSAGGNDLIVANEGKAIDNRTICYQLECINLNSTHTFQFVTIFILTLIYVILFFHTNTNFIRKLVMALFVTLIANIMIIDLFANINSEVRIVSFKNDGQTVELQPGETKIFKLLNNQCVFDVLHIFFGGENKTGLHISFGETDSGKIIAEKDVTENNLIIDPTNGKTAVSLRPLHRVKTGNYEITVENRSGLPIYLCTYDDTLNVVEIKYTKLGYYIAFVLVLILLSYVGILIYFIDKKSISIEKYFLVSVIALGMCNFIMFTPWNIPDSGAHYLASYRLSNIVLGFPNDQEWYGRTEDDLFFNNIWGKDNNPSMLGYTDLAYNFDLICKDKTIAALSHNDPKMEYYSILSYWPQTLGIAVGRIVGFSAIACSYLAKLMIFVFYVWGCLNAIRITPIGKSVFAMVSLFPMSLMNSSAISYDPLVLITTLNFIAGIFALYKYPTSKKYLLQTIIWCFMVGATKGGGYLILLPLVFILINRTNVKNSFINCASIITSGLFSVLLFDKLLQIGNTLFQFGNEGNGKMAAMYAFEHPIKYVQMCLITYLGNANTLLFDMIGSNLAWIEYTIPPFILLGLVVITILYAIFEEDKITLTKKFKYTFEVITMLIVMATPAMLLSWTNKGSTTIAGLQGRYYLPVLTIAILGITKFSLHITDFSHTEYKKACLIKNKFFYVFAMLSCLVVYYMMRLYLRR